MSVVFDALAEFGAKIMNPVDGVAILDLSDEQRENLKSQLLKALDFDLHEKSQPRVADACVEVFKKCDRKWDALVEAAFCESERDVQGFLFVRFVSACEHEFVEANMEKIVGCLVKLLPKASCYLQTGMIVILSNIDENEAFRLKPELVELMWSALLHVATVEPERWEFICPVVADIFEDAPDSANVTPKCVEAAIGEIADVKGAQPVLHMVSFLNGELLVKLLEKLCEVARREIDEKKEVPNELITMIDESQLDMISEEKLKLVSDYLKTKIESVDGLALFAPFSAHIAMIFGPEEIWKVVESCLSQDPLHVTLGLKVFECISNYTDDLEFDLPDPLMYKFVGFLTHELPQVKAAAFAALGSLIENDVFIHKDHVEVLLKEYPRIARDDLIRYFKLLRKILRVEGVSDEVIIMLFEFANKTIHDDKDALVRSQCLSIISCVASQDADNLVETEIGTLSPIATELMKADDPTGYSYGSRVLVLFVSLAPDICRRPVLALLPKFFEIAQGTSGLSPKIQANIAVALASILVRLNVEKDFPKIVEIVQTFVSSNDNHLISAAAVITEIMRAAKDEINKKLYTLLAGAALTTRDRIVFNAILNALRKILKTYPIPEEETIPLFTSILTGAHPIFNRKPPSIFTDKDTKIFSYLLAVSIRYPNQIGQIAAAIVSWVCEAPAFMISCYLELIEHLVEEKAIKGEAATKIVRLLLSHIGERRGTLEEVVAGITMMILKQEQHPHQTPSSANAMTCPSPSQPFSTTPPTNGKPSSPPLPRRSSTFSCSRKSNSTSTTSSLPPFKP